MEEEKQSEGKVSPYALRLAEILQQRWHREIERAIDKVKLGVVPAEKRTANDKWFRRQWYRAKKRPGLRVEYD